jgi:hypothetical protein
MAATYPGIPCPCIFAPADCRVDEQNQLDSNIVNGPAIVGLDLNEAVSVRLFPGRQTNTIHDDIF